MHTSTQTQTVITWRNIPATARYIQYENPCLLLIGNALCYIISGLALLVFGVIVTSVTFQNLERHTEGNTERYVGPVLIVVGALLLARGTFNQFHFVETRTRERILIRDCQPTLYSSRQITEVRFMNLPLFLTFLLIMSVCFDHHCCQYNGILCGCHSDEKCIYRYKIRVKSLHKKMPVPSQEFDSF